MVTGNAIQSDDFLQPVARRSVSPAWTLEHLISSGLVVCVVFLNGADFRGATGDDGFTVHWQIYLRLLICFACGAVGALNLFPRTYREFVVWPGMLLLAYVGMLGLSIPMSVDARYSTASWASLIGVLLFLPSAMRLLGGPRFLRTVLAGLVIHLIGSWIAYLCFPSVGVFMEQVSQSDVFERMGGLAHPNELGFYSAFTVLLAAGLGLRKHLPPWLAGCAIALGGATLLVCFSRTAIVTCCIGLCFTFQYQLFRRGNLIALTTLCALASLTAFATIGTGKFDWQVSEVMTKLTKSGNTSELATATGRTEIWSAAIGFIQESPLIGYGYGTARFVMEEHSFHGHNTILNAMLSAGVPCGIIVMSMMAVLVYYLAFDPRPEIDGLAACTMIAGMLDGVLGAASPNAFLTVWVTCLLWRQMRLGLQPSGKQPSGNAPSNSKYAGQPRLRLDA